MKKSKSSVKGEYSFADSINSPTIRNFQALLDSRNRQLSATTEMMSGNEHKMEFVKTIRGIDFINDSASSNANGIYMALSNVEKKVTWITSFTEWGKLDEDLVTLISQKVEKVIFYGYEDSKTETFLDALHIHNECSTDLETVVRTAFYSTNFNQAVLFSPGIPAGDDFQNYSERGENFKKAVAQL